jgi:hypothetical protein
MTKLTFGSACLMVCLIGCASPRPPKNAADAPDPTGSESSEPQSSTSSESTKPATSDPAAAASKPSTESGPTKPPCTGLPKSKCKVTMGCAWYDQPGKSKCVGE